MLCWLAACLSSPLACAWISEPPPRLCWQALPSPPLACAWISESPLMMLCWLCSMWSTSSGLSMDTWVAANAFACLALECTLLWLDAWIPESPAWWCFAGLLCCRKLLWLEHGYLSRRFDGALPAFAGCRGSSGLCMDTWVSDDARAWLPLLLLRSVTAPSARLVTLATVSFFFRFFLLLLWLLAALRAPAACCGRHGSSAAKRLLQDSLTQEHVKGPNSVLRMKKDVDGVSAYSPPSKTAEA